MYNISALSNRQVVIRIIIIKVISCIGFVIDSTRGFYMCGRSKLSAFALTSYEHILGERLTGEV